MGSRHRGPKDEVRALNALIALSRCTESVAEKTRAEFEAVGLTESQFGVLEALHHLGPLCAAELADKLLRSRGNLTLVLANLERDGLIERTARQEDRRYLTIGLTAKGRGLVKRVFPRHARLVTRTMRALTPDEQESLRTLCRKLGRGV